jgi:hypothetical protein
MTIGSFRLGELAALYRAQGWRVSVLLVTRDLPEILRSLTAKWYGHDGSTGDDPPLFTRLQRYHADLDEAAANGWARLDHAALLADPATALAGACSALDLTWDDGMLSWPRDPDSFAYPSLGNESLRATLGSGGVAEAIARYRERTAGAAAPVDAARGAGVDALLACFDRPESGAGLAPSRYRGTRRERLEREIDRLYREEIGPRTAYIARLWRHPVLGRVLAAWVRWVNPALAPPTPDPDTRHD